MTPDALPFLADSTVRPRLLGALERMGPARPSDLRDELDVSRATVHRNLSALTDRGWVRQTDDGYVTTTAGLLVHDHFETFRVGLETVERFQGLLEHIPADAVPPLSVLATADLVTTGPDTPHAPVMRYVEELTESETSTVYGLSPVRSEMFSHGHEQLLEAGVDTELLLPAAVLDRERDDAGADFGDTLETTGFALYVLEGDPGFGLTVADDRAFLGGYGPDNQMVALAVSTADEFVAWAEERYASLRDSASNVERAGAEQQNAARPD
jgi:predicted transcriptional regulator